MISAASEVTPIMEVRNLSCSFAGKTILSDISFDILKGEFAAVVGPNGAGKSTLLKCLGGLAPLAGGSVAVLGEPTASMSACRIARSIAWLHQNGAADMPYTVRQFAMLSRYPWRPVLSGESDEDRVIVEKMLKRAGADKYADRVLSTLSGGERQRALLAAALAQETEILFLDEPASFLDYSSQAEMLELIEAASSEGKTIVMVTHDINMALHGADRIIALKGGGLVWNGAAEDFLSCGMMNDIFGTDFVAFQNAGQMRPYVVPMGLVS